MPSGLQNLRVIRESQIQGELGLCPYCGSQPRFEHGCCGESSAHFQLAYDLGDEFVLQEEVRVVPDEGAT